MANLQAYQSVKVLSRLARLSKCLVLSLEHVVPILEGILQLSPSQQLAQAPELTDLLVGWMALFAQHAADMAAIGIMAKATTAANVISTVFATVVSLVGTNDTTVVTGRIEDQLATKPGFDLRLVTLEASTAKRSSTAWQLAIVVGSTGFAVVAITVTGAVVGTAETIARCCKHVLAEQLGRSFHWFAVLNHPFASQARYPLGLVTPPAFPLVEPSHLLAVQLAMIGRRCYWTQVCPMSPFQLV